MAWLRVIVGAVLLFPSVGCTLCCAPFDQCGPLCNGECGGGCCSTMRAGGYNSVQTSYYEQAPTGSPRLAPTPAKPRPVPREESPMETEAPVVTPDDNTTSPAETPLDTPADPGFDTFPGDAPTTTPYGEGDAVEEPPFTQPETTEDPAVDPEQDFPEMDSGIPGE